MPRCHRHDLVRVRALDVRLPDVLSARRSLRQQLLYAVPDGLVRELAGGVDVNRARGLCVVLLPLARCGCHWKDHCPTWPHSYVGKFRGRPLHP
jgi:hypothetical protein